MKATGNRFIGIPVAFTFVIQLYTHHYSLTQTCSISSTYIMCIPPFSPYQRSTISLSMKLSALIDCSYSLRHSRVILDCSKVTLPSSVNIGFNPVDVPIIRYADVLLSLAEAINEQGRWQEAVTYVNKVRSRAGVALLNTPGNDAVSVSSVEDMRVRIRNEKKWELACEEQLYCEELRWGTWDEDKFAAGNGLQNVWGSPVYTYIWGGDAYLKWAIPQSEVEKNTNIKQNEGWN